VLVLIRVSCRQTHAGLKSESKIFNSSLLLCILSMQWHVNKVASACFYHIRRLKQIRRLIGPEVTATLMSTFVLSKMDYCNAILAGLPKSTIAPLQRAQNAAARLIGLVAPRNHVTSTLQ